MSRTAHRTRPRRNTGPLWKKLAVVLSAPIAAMIGVGLFDATAWTFFLFLVVVVGCAALAMWGTTKLLGVHLSLGGWD